MSEQAAPPTPTTGQPLGDGGQDGTIEAPGANTPWDLNSAPEELRPYLQQELKKIEGGITQKFQEAAEFRRRMEPLSAFADVEGINDVPAEELSELVQFRQLIQDPEAFEQWFRATGEEMGFFDGAAADQGDVATPDDGEVPPWAQQLMERLDGLEGSTRQNEVAAREQAALAQIDADLTSLREEHGDFDEDAVCSLAMAYDDEDAITKAFADYQRITGQARAELVDSKDTTGSFPVSGGQADMAPDQVNGFADAKTLARARFSSAR